MKTTGISLEIRTFETRIQIVGSNPILSAILTRKNPLKRTLRAFASRNAFAGAGKVGGKKRF